LNSFRALARLAADGGEGLCGRAAAAGAFSVLIRALARPQPISDESMCCRVAVAALNLAKALTEGSLERSTWLASEAGALPLLVAQLASHPRQEAIDAAACTLVNISRSVFYSLPPYMARPEQVIVLRRLMAAGAPAALAALLRRRYRATDAPPVDVRDAAGTLAVLGAIVPGAARAVVDLGVLPALAAMLATAHADGQLHYELPLFFLACCTTAAGLYDAVFESGAVPHLVALLRLPEEGPGSAMLVRNKKLWSASALGVLALHHPPAKRAALRAGAAPALSALQRHADPAVATASAMALRYLQGVMVELGGTVGVLTVL
jgi:hypothetical protein